MILLVIFAFFAGVVTVLSPCILPLLPIILSSTIGGAQTGKARPLGVITGFVASFTFFTLFLATIVKVIGIPADTLRLFSVIVIAEFGLSMVIPQFQVLLEKLFSTLSRFIPQGNTNSSFGSGLLVGISLGLLWTPCVGPILASVISLAITETVTVNAFIITLAYSIGTAIPMFAIMVGGQNVLRKIPWLLTNSAAVQKVFGVIMILTALAIFTNLDRKFQTFILNTFPNYGVGLTKFEDIPFIRGELQKLHGKEIKKEDIGKLMFDLQPKGIKAPAIIPGGVWFNLPDNKNTLTLAQLKGKVVLIDFWTYSCINCQRTLPYLRKWYDIYKDKGLVIIGVHSPEFEFEKNPDNVRKAIADFKLTYPIVQDNNFDTWRAYDNNYWPAKYFIDKEGYIRHTHFGEGAYDESEQVIQKLLSEMGASDVAIPINNPSYQVYAKTPETYLGYGRLDRFVSPEQVIHNQLSSYSSPAILPDNAEAYEGNWIVMEEYANPQKGAKLLLNFESKEVFLVMRTSANPARIKVYVDNKLQYFGEDNKNGIVTIDADRLYKLVNLPSPGRHMLKLDFEDNNTQLYAFTFG